MTFVEIKDYEIATLVERVIKLQESRSANERAIITIAGVPGSGKSTISQKVCSEVNKRIGRKTVAVLGQDGFHYYRSQLKIMEDPEEAFDRRGAPFTFNSELLLKLTNEIKRNTYEVIYAPSFDHKDKDPIENSIEITPEIRVILLEGNYVHLNEGNWREICSLSDERWLVAVDLDVIVDRLIKRHLEAGICSSIVDSKRRVENLSLIHI